MSYNVTLNKKLPEQGVYDQLLGGHIVNRKQIKLYPRSGAGPFSPQRQQNIQFRVPSHGYIDFLRSYMTYTLNVYCDTASVRHWGNPLVRLNRFASSSTDKTLTELHYETAADDICFGSTPQLTSDSIKSSYNDPCAYILGGYNGSTASPFRMFRVLMDGEPIEYIDHYNGLVALLSMNIGDSYRRSALGHMQFLSPRGTREMILSALTRGDHPLVRNVAKNGGFDLESDTQYSHSAWAGIVDPVSEESEYKSEIKTLVDGHIVRTQYPDLIHLPMSGILSNSKLLPAKFLGNMDIEFQLASTAETLHVCSGFAVNQLVSSHVGSVLTGPRTLVFKYARPDVNPAQQFTLQNALAPSAAFSNKIVQRSLLATVAGVVTGGTYVAGSFNENEAKMIDSALVEKFYLNDTFLRSIRYEIVDPVYHLEVVYMSEAYDAAFDDALTRGVTYSFETYTATNAPITGDGAVHVPVSKTSIKGVFAGFINNDLQSAGVLTNYWQFVNPDILEYQCKFGAKLVPAEPLRVKHDQGLQSLMMYLKAVNMHYNPLAGFHYGWCMIDPSDEVNMAATGQSTLNSAVVFGSLGTTQAGPCTWMSHTGKSKRVTDLTRAIGEFESTQKLDGTNKKTANFLHGIISHPSGNFNISNDGDPDLTSCPAALSRDLRYSAYTHLMGAFAIGLDLETEQDALSGINTAGSTAALQWTFKFEKNPATSMTLYTWLLHDKALRLEPFGRVSVIVD